MLSFSNNTCGSEFFKREILFFDKALRFKLLFLISFSEFKLLLNNVLFSKPFTEFILNSLSFLLFSLNKYLLILSLINGF